MGIAATGAYAGYSILNMAARDYTRAVETGKPADPSLVEQYGSAMKGLQNTETLKMAKDFVNIYNKRNDQGSLLRQNTQNLGQPNADRQVEDQGRKNQGLSNPNASEDSEKTLEDLKCETCENRKYVDASSDPGVSYQIPTNISRGAAAARVMSHEHEHVSREQDKARREGKEVIAQGVKIKTDICPECGKIYVSGGQTTTTTKDAEAVKDIMKAQMELLDQLKDQQEELSIGLVKNIDYFEKRSEELKEMFMVGAEETSAGSMFDQSA